MRQFNFRYEVHGNGTFEGKQFEDNLQIEAESEIDAREIAEHQLEEEFPGEEDWLLLSLELVSQVS